MYLALFGSELEQRTEYEKVVIPGIVTRCIQEVELRGISFVLFPLPRLTPVQVWTLKGSIARAEETAKSRSSKKASRGATILISPIRISTFMPSRPF